MALPNFNDAERKALMMALMGLSPQKLQQITMSELGEPISTYGATSDEMPVLTIRFLEWIAPQPANLIKFLDGLIVKLPGFPGIQVLQAHSARLKQIVAIAPADPIDACLIDAVVMVNRAQLRTTLRNILGGHKRPVVAVTGPTQSGRSRSWHLINHVGRAHNVAVQYIDLKIWVVEERTLDRLFDRLVADLALSGHVTRPTTEGANFETVGTRFANEIVECVGRRPFGVEQWLILDSLDRPMATEIAAFVRQLCEQRLAGHLQNCTLFLLGESAQLAAPEGLTVKETLTPFTDEEVAEAARHINGLGTKPLAKTELNHRRNTFSQELAACPAEQCGALISRMLTALRIEVGAP